MSTHLKFALILWLAPAALNLAHGQPISEFGSAAERHPDYGTPRVDTRPTWEQWRSGDEPFEVRRREEPGAVSADQLRRPLKGKGRDAILKAEKLLAKGKVAEALALLEKAVEMPDAQPYALSLLGTQHLKMGLFPQAIAELEQSAAVLEGSAMVHNNLALALAITGQTERARKAATKAVQLDPGNAKTRFILASLLLSAGERAEAVYHLRVAAPEIPRAAQLLQTLAAQQAPRPLPDAAMGFQSASK